MQIGRFDKLPNYHVIGRPVEFYIWIDKDGSYGDKASNWIKGATAFRSYNELQRIFKKDKNSWMLFCDQLHKEHKK